MGRESNAELELERLVLIPAIQRDRTRPWRLAALLVREATVLATAPLMVAASVAVIAIAAAGSGSCGVRRRPEKGLIRNDRCVSY